MPGIFKSLNDSASYCIEHECCGLCRRQGICPDQYGAGDQSITDILNGKPVLMDEASCNNLDQYTLMGEPLQPESMVRPKGYKVIQNALDSISYAIGANHTTFFNPHVAEYSADPPGRWNHTGQTFPDQ